MPTDQELISFFGKRGVHVAKVEHTDAGIVVHVDRPEDAREVFGAVQDKSNLVFVLYQEPPKPPWYRKLIFWRK